VDTVDSVWFTLWALHNWLLEVDGLTEEWVGGVHTVVSEWEGDIVGCLDYEGVPVEVPNALARLSANLDPHNFDSSGLGPGSDVMTENRALLRSKVLVELSDSASRIDDSTIMMGITNGVYCYLSLNVFVSCRLTILQYCSVRIKLCGLNVKLKRGYYVHLR
jgi:hypothetical protein